MGDPVSWLVIEKGWTVVSADGREVGHVDEIVGDSSLDIFNGLAISTGLLSASRYVPAERVAEITEERIQLDLREAEIDDLPKHEAPPSAEIRPE
jgi:hypothetical protein